MPKKNLRKGTKKVSRVRSRKPTAAELERYELNESKSPKWNNKLKGGLSRKIYPVVRPRKTT